MYTARLRNSRGYDLELTDNEGEYQVLDIQGLEPAPASVNITKYAGQDGGGFNSANLNTKNIVIMLKINGDVESNRLTLYRLFVTKEPCRFFYKNESVDVYIDGYVETVECGHFTNSETMQVSILCPFPYFSSVATNSVNISKIIPETTFPLEFSPSVEFSRYEANYTADIINVGDSNSGATITVDFNTQSYNFTLTNEATQEKIKLTYWFRKGDKLVITTGERNKSIKLTSYGVTINLFSAMSIDSILFPIRSGSNYISYDCANPDQVDITVDFSANYRGV